eukprot:14676904-Alexandrium_andersonii.AAC.1
MRRHAQARPDHTAIPLSSKQDGQRPILARLTRPGALRHHCEALPGRGEIFLHPDTAGTAWG